MHLRQSSTSGCFWDVRKVHTTFFVPLASNDQVCCTFVIEVSTSIQHVV